MAAELRDALLQSAPELMPDDISIVPAGVPGEDLWLSPRAREIYPFTFESKNVERLNIYQALEQSQRHAEGTAYQPVLVFRKNRYEPQVVITLALFLRLFRQ